MIDYREMYASFLALASELGKDLLFALLNVAKALLKLGKSYDFLKVFV